MYQPTLYNPDDNPVYTPKSVREHYIATQRIQFDGAVTSFNKLVSEHEKQFLNRGGLINITTIITSLANYPLADEEFRSAMLLAGWEIFSPTVSTSDNKILYYACPSMKGK